MKSRHIWKSLTGLAEDLITEHRVQFKEGSKGCVSGLYCETHRKWVCLFHSDNIEISGNSCIRSSNVKVAYQK